MKTRPKSSKWTKKVWLKPARILAKRNQRSEIRSTRLNPALITLHLLRIEQHAPATAIYRFSLRRTVSTPRTHVAQRSDGKTARNMSWTEPYNTPRYNTLRTNTLSKTLQKIIRAANIQSKRRYHMSHNAKIAYFSLCSASSIVPPRYVSTQISPGAASVCNKQALLF